MARSNGEVPGGRTHWKESEAARFIARWQASGVSLPAYCEEQGVRYERVRRWRQKLTGGRRNGGRDEGRVGERLDPKPKRTTLSLRELHIGSPLAAGSELEVELRSGHLLRVRGGIEVERVVSLIRALEALSC